MKVLLDLMKKEIVAHRGCMAEIAQRTFSLGDRSVQVVVCPGRNTASAWIGCLHLDSHVCDQMGARELAEAIVAQCGAQWNDCGFEITHIINLAMGIL